MKPPPLTTAIACLLGLAALAAAALSTEDSVPQPKPTGPKDVDRDLNKLTPGFRRRVLRVLAAMTERGFDPYVYEAFRTRERAKMLADRVKASGRGIAIEDSMHCYGLAVDIISKKAHWGASEAFKKALGEAARAEGLTWGGAWGDAWHVQAVTIAQQGIARKATRAQLEQMTA